jgi:hypothetical protein
VDELGDEDVPGLRSAADAAGEVDGGPEHVVVVVDWLACGHPDSNAKVRLHAGQPPGLEPALDGQGAVQGAGHVVERRHDPVSGVLHLASSRGHQRAPDDVVVLGEQDHVGGFADLLQEGCRALKVREQDRSEGTRYPGRIGGVMNLSQEPEEVVLRDADDLVGDQSVRSLVSILQCARTLRLGEAERQTAVGIEPVGEELHVVLGLHLEVAQVRLRNLLGRQARQLVAVHEERQGKSLL